MNLWPYVNGRAIMSGVQLRTLSGPDLVDVLHYMYETDLLVSTAEEQEAKDRARTVIYEQLYEQDYPYSSTQTQDYSRLDPPLNDDEEPLPVPLDPKAMSARPKAFVPATKFNPNAANPYNGVLDAPLG